MLLGKFIKRAGTMAKAKKEMIVSDDVILNKIHFIRGQKAMLDRDLVKLYGVTNGNLNKAVSRNIDHFPGDFMFTLTKEEMNSLMFQNGISG